MTARSTVFKSVGTVKVLPSEQEVNGGKYHQTQDYDETDGQAQAESGGENSRIWPGANVNKYKLPLNIEAACK